MHRSRKEGGTVYPLEMISLGISSKVAYTGEAGIMVHPVDLLVRIEERCVGQHCRYHSLRLKWLLPEYLGLYVGIYLFSTSLRTLVIKDVTRFRHQI